MQINPQRNPQSLILIALIAAGEIYFGISPHADRTTWLLENFPIFIILPLTIYLQPKWELSKFVLIVMTLHAFVLMQGGHYTYAEVPFGFWLKETFRFSRNPYDRIGHFFQGFTPALLLWEVLPKKTATRSPAFQCLIIVSMCLAFSAFYELIEWSAALIMGQGADAFLGTQGDPWDTQWDMFMALIGAALASVISLSLCKSKKT